MRVILLYDCAIHSMYLKRARRKMRIHLNVRRHAFGYSHAPLKIEIERATLSWRGIECTINKHQLLFGRRKITITEVITRGRDGNGGCASHTARPGPSHVQPAKPPEIVLS